MNVSRQGCLRRAFKCKNRSILRFLRPVGVVHTATTQDSPLRQVCLVNSPGIGCIRQGLAMGKVALREIPRRSDTPFFDLTRRSREK